MHTKLPNIAMHCSVPTSYKKLMTQTIKQCRLCSIESIIKCSLCVKTYQELQDRIYMHSQKYKIKSNTLLVRCYEIYMFSKFELQQNGRFMQKPRYGQWTQYLGPQQQSVNYFGHHKIVRKSSELFKVLFSLLAHRHCPQEILKSHRIY